MCGIVGMLARSLPDEAALRAACDAIRHRGPDADGLWTDRDAGVALGHRRLAVIELTDAGAQPMVSASGRFVIVYNGEIYNHLTMRKLLFREEWRGQSDTETLLEAIATWGLERTLRCAVGMFAFALWDREARKLTLVRDRFGEKPLYYGLHDGKFLFASELAALNALSGFRPEVDRAALAGYLKYLAVPGEQCIWQGFRKLRPGTCVEFAPGATRLPEPRVYWDAEERALAGTGNPLVTDDDDAIDQLDAVLRGAVKGQMLSDVPLGALLSGGVDSSTIVALMQSESSQPVRTFSIGYDDPLYDEAQHAQAVAAHLGTDHTEVRVTAADALAVVPKLPAMYSEPFADSSQIPTHLVCAMARRHVTVALSGDGGDEVFAGYNRHAWAETYRRRLGRLPRPLRGAIASAIDAVPPAGWDRLFGVLNPVLPKRARLALAGDKFGKGAELLRAGDQAEVYESLISVWKDPNRGAEHRSHIKPIENFTEWMMVQDTVGYLPDDILTKVDRAAMSVSLETRVPLLDHRVYEFAWQLPLNMKLRGGQGKWILRQLLYRHVPRKLIERPKMGFAAPIHEWLRGPLRDWAESLLSVERLTRDGYIAPGPVREKWAQHLSGKRNWQHHLWAVLMFNAWLDENS